MSNWNLKSNTGNREYKFEWKHLESLRIEKKYLWKNVSANPWIAIPILERNRFSTIFQWSPFAKQLIYSTQKYCHSVSIRITNWFEIKMKTQSNHFNMIRKKLQFNISIYLELLIIIIKCERCALIILFKVKFLTCFIQITFILFCSILKI